MAEIKDLSTTDANNNGVAANAGFPEAMAPSDVNNAARALEGMIARYFADINGTLTSGGSSNTYTLTPNRTVSAYTDGDVYVFEANHTNTGAATLNVSSLGAKSIKRPDGSALLSNDIVSGGRYHVTYDGTNFQLLGVDNRRVGTFTPTLTFATPGDLSMAYTTREATWIRHGNRVLVNIHLNCTPTFSTASGNLRIATLPFAADSTRMTNSQSLLLAQASGAGLDWGTGKTQLTGYAVRGQTYCEIFGSGSTKASEQLTASDVTSGSLILIRLHGEYETDG